MNEGKGWTVAKARTWLDNHDLKNDKVDETSQSFRFRQLDPAQYKAGSFKTLTENFPKGVSAVSCVTSSAASEYIYVPGNDILRARLELAMKS